MTDLDEALALYDLASRIDRLRFQLRSLTPAPTIPGLNEVSTQVYTLAGITAAISEQVNLRLSDGLARVPRQKALQAYSDALAPLGEAMTELGRLQTEIVYFDFTAFPALHDSPSDLQHRRQQANELITGCCGAADEILEAAAGELRAAATELAPTPTRIQATALAHSPHTPAPAKTAAHATVPPSPANAAPGTARGR
ncbi:hypothetical protein [Streptomyces sp. NPDC001508]|uniref:hypothetical protein n=1 Tax=Streptomyces sp. NPDC001508 TaxID=3154656 RepID=UPI00331F683F